MEKKIRPQDRWNTKAGYISKSYKLKKELVEQFEQACKTAGVSQAGKLTQLMKAFIEEEKYPNKKNFLLQFFYILKLKKSNILI